VTRAVAALLFVAASLLFVATVVGGAWLARQAYRAHVLEVERRQVAEAESLRRLGLLVAERRTRAELEARAAELVASDADLRGQLERLRRARAGARPVVAVQASTGPIAAQGEPPATQSEAPCLLRPGDTTEIRVTELHLLTEAGNRAVIGAARFIRLGPPDSVLAAGPWAAELSSVEEVEPVRPWWTGWRIAGAVGVALGVGLVAGMALD
jgi:hypothetical protein